MRLIYNGGSFVIKDLTTVFNNIEFKYIFKKRKYDCNSMIVVFSGFGATGNFTYDFINVLNEINSAVLWIKDDFYGNAAYYYSVNGREIHTTVNAFILDIAQKNNILKDNIILSGFSKGGSAALFYALKYNYSKIIATVPQIRIATYCKKSHQDVLTHMLGNDHSDEQYQEQVEPFIDQFYKFSNFNLFYSESILVRTHNQVTSHHIQLILSWFYSLSVGLAPSYGIKKIQGDNIKTSNVEVGKYIIELRKLKIEGKKIYPEGIGIVRNYNFKEWGDVDYSLIFENQKRSYEIKIAKGHQPRLTREFYDGFFAIYDKAYFTTYKYNGIDISHIEKGVYILKLKIDLKNLDQHIVDHLNGQNGFTGYNNEYYNFYVNRHNCIEVIIK